jgi:hypothetical protein
MVCAGGKLMISRCECEEESSTAHMDGRGVVGDDEDVVIYKNYCSTANVWVENM